jgi:hypothetical protein
MQTYTIEMKIGTTSAMLYIDARAEVQALKLARAQGAKMVSATAIRFASFIFC